MTFEAFKQSLLNQDAPAINSAYLLSLWYDAKGDWEKAHHIIQEIDDQTAAWIHAYLHRKEGDIGNADYWYTRAKRKRPGSSTEDEWKDIVINLLH